MTPVALTLLIFGSGLMAMIAIAYAVPIRRTWRKETDQELNIPGPQGLDDASRRPSQA